jgi:hypothetical protein
MCFGTGVQTPGRRSGCTSFAKPTSTTKSQQQKINNRLWIVDDAPTTHRRSYRGQRYALPTALTFAHKLHSPFMMNKIMNFKIQGRELSITSESVAPALCGVFQACVF